MQVEDIHGQPGVLLRAEMTRDAFKRLRADTAAFMWLFIIAGGVFCVVSIHLLGKLVLTRLMRLSKNVIGIAESSDLSARLPEDGNDELTHLAEAINGMLESLEHSEMERQENAEQLETLIENQGEGVLIVDIDGSIIFANPAAAQIFGTPRTGLLGVKINDFVTPADLAVINAQREKCRSGQKARCEIEVLRGPMDRRAVLVTASPRLDDDGNFIGTFKVVRDITDIRVAESLKATVDAKNDFLSMVSHELRTPLVPIISYADLLLDGTFGQLPETCREPLKTINERAQKLKSLIDDLLQFTRLDNGTLQMNRTTFSVLGYVHNIVRTNWEIHKLPSSSLRVNGDDFEVHADPERLRQIIDNLIENAIKYSDAVLDVTVSLRADDRNGYVSVSDKGVGISPEHLPFVFDKFYQVEHLDTRKHEGVGLGLALAKELARLMNGTLSVESEVGKGSTFTLTLPLAGSSSRRTDDEGKDEGREKAGFDQDSTPAEVVRSIASSLRELGSEGSNVSRETDQKKGD
jgi:two-component system phosphate regulon sensor histidine kinase PhoR